MLIDGAKWSQYISNKNSTTLVSALFPANLAVVLCCLTLQDKHNITTLSEDIAFICSSCETVFKAQRNKFSDNVRMLSLSLSCLHLNIIPS